VNGRIYSRHVSAVKKTAAFLSSNFCKAKDKYCKARKRSSRYQSHQGDKYATPDSTRGLIDDGPLRADHLRLFMLHWAARASDVLVTSLVLNESSALRARKWLWALFEIARVLVRFDHVAPELDGSLRRGRLTSSPLQFGQTKCICSAQLAQYVHS
jgi:hypothetical protein